MNAARTRCLLWHESSWAMALELWCWKCPRTVVLEMNVFRGTVVLEPKAFCEMTWIL